jgi:hypothetical protein
MTVVEEQESNGTLEALLERLSRQSVTPGKHFDAYVDIDWDAAELQVEPSDPRWELVEWDPLGASEWYRTQPQAVRSQIGLHRIAEQMRTGLEFENVLQRGLLELAFRLPNGSPLFRYIHHEVIEESQHSLMFQEFANRSGTDPAGIPRLLRPGTIEVVKLARRLPGLFFLFILGGEEPIDYVQRRALREEREHLHPLLERIMRIHVTEEARHLSFARHYLRERVPELGWLRRQLLGLGAPLILGVMAALMLRPSRQMLRRYKVPHSVVRTAFRSPSARLELHVALRRARGLCDELGLITPASRLIWRGLGMMDPTLGA